MGAIVKYIERTKRQNMKDIVDAVYSTSHSELKSLLQSQTSLLLDYGFSSSHPLDYSTLDKTIAKELSQKIKSLNKKIEMGESRLRVIEQLRGKLNIKL